MAKAHTIENVTYGARGGKWKFEAPNYSYTTPTMPGGATTAHRVARIINGAVKRGGMDNLARANMAKVFHAAAPVTKHAIVH